MKIDTGIAQGSKVKSSYQRDTVVQMYDPQNTCKNILASLIQKWIHLSSLKEFSSGEFNKLYQETIEVVLDVSCLGDKHGEIH